MRNIVPDVVFKTRIRDDAIQGASHGVVGGEIHVTKWL